MLHRVVVPLDGSEFSEHAIPIALDVAGRGAGGGRVDLLTVHDPVPATQGAPPMDPRLDEAMRQATRRELTATAMRWGGEGDVTIDGEVRAGPIVGTIAEYVKDRGADLVVMTSHGRGGLSRLWLGSTAEGLVRRVEVPVLLLRPGPDDSPPRLGEFTRVLIPLDGTGFGEAAVDRAIDLLGTDGVEYTLLQVISPEPVVLSAAEPLHDNLIFDARKTLAMDYLASLADRVGRCGATVRWDVLAEARTAPAIVEYARAHGIGLIAMVTHARGEMSRLLFGSVADKILRSSPSPLLLLRPRKH